MANTREQPLQAILCALLIVLAIAVLPAPLLAQPDQPLGAAAQALGGNSAPGGSGIPGGSSGFGPRHKAPQTDSAPGEMPELKPTIAPAQRLDAGALLCHTEAQLKQHQAAIMARLSGRTAPEPGGCRIVSEMLAVSIVSRDGPAVTQVQLGGDTPELGWTDAVIRDADPVHSPLR